MTDPTVLAEGLTFAEGPRWREGRFWFSDFFSHRVLSTSIEGDVRIELEIDDRPSGLGWLPDGQLLVVSMTERRVLRVEADGQLVEHADLSDLATYHCNDMVVDDGGRAYVGNFGADIEDFFSNYGLEGLIGEPGFPPAAVMIVEPDGDARWGAHSMRFPNGSVITPDESTLIVAETFGSCLTAFSRDSSGALSDRREWASLATDAGPVLPDGICLDADGGIWVADAFGSGLLRVLEGGEITDRVVTRQTAFACMLGGPDGRHLLACTAPSSDPAVVAGAQLATLELVEVDVARAGLP